MANVHNFNNNLIIELFQNAKCTWRGRCKDPNTFYFGPNTGFISITEACKLHCNKQHHFSIISIDLADSKLGDMLNEYDRNK